MSCAADPSVNVEEPCCAATWLALAASGSAVHGIDAAPPSRVEP